MTPSPSAPGPAAPDWRRNQAAVTGATFIGFTGFTLVMPFLPLYFEQLGVRDPASVAVWSGFSLGVTPAVTAAMAPVWARLALRYGRKMMVARSLGSFVIIMSLMGLVTAPWQVFALRAIQGLFAGYGPIAMTMAAESAPPDQIANAIGWVQTAQRLGPALGPVIGGSLAQTIGIPHSVPRFGRDVPLAFLFVIVGYREVRAPLSPRHEAEAERVNLRTLRPVPHFVLLMTVVFGLQMVDRSLGPILPLYLREIGFASARVPLSCRASLFTVTAGAAAVGNQTSAWLLRRRPPRSSCRRWRRSRRGAALIFSASAARGGAPGDRRRCFGFALGTATTCTSTPRPRTRCRRRWRGIAFGYLTSAYLIGPGRQSGRRRVHRRAQHAGRVSWPMPPVWPCWRGCVHRGMRRDAAR